VRACWHVGKVRGSSARGDGIAIVKAIARVTDTPDDVNTSRAWPIGQSIYESRSPALLHPARHCLPRWPILHGPYRSTGARAQRRARSRACTSTRMDVAEGVDRAGGTDR